MSRMKMSRKTLVAALVVIGVVAGALWAVKEKVGGIMDDFVGRGESNVVAWIENTREMKNLCPRVFATMEWQHCLDSRWYDDIEFFIIAKGDGVACVDLEKAAYERRGAGVILKLPEPEVVGARIVGDSYRTFDFDNGWWRDDEDEVRFECRDRLYEKIKARLEEFRDEYRDEIKAAVERTIRRLAGKVGIEVEVRWESGEQARVAQALM